MNLRVALPSDYLFIRSIEELPNVNPWIGSTTSEIELISLLENPDCTVLIFELNHDPIGFTILKGLSNEGRSIELMRIALKVQGKGLGKVAMQIVLNFVFLELKYASVWLDVVPNNENAIRLYQKFGFEFSFTQKQSMLKNGVLMDMSIYTLNASNYNPQ